jgi:hypothetical protein
MAIREEERRCSEGLDGPGRGNEDNFLYCPIELEPPKKKFKFAANMLSRKTAKTYSCL